MFIWSSKLYMDERVKKHPKRYRRLVEGKKLLKHCYALALPRNEKNCLDLYSTREFWFRYYHEQEMKIVGLAASKDTAEELLCQMMGDVYQAYGKISAELVHRFFEQETWKCVKK